MCTIDFASEPSIPLTEKVNSSFPVKVPQLLNLTSLDRSHRIVYNVQRTHTRPEIYPCSRMDREILRLALASVQSYCLHLLAILGEDAQLALENDPYVQRGPIGGIVAMSSTPGQKLKISTIVDMMKGLIDVLYTQASGCGADVQIYRDSVMVGMGSVTARSEHSKSL